ncbi:RrF2 family transcriptional regulator [Cohnella cellulosilytica]|uniref:RrF2 family transcriptional regulator n=1 Tax=Cohnella cellulosilytica TaxID=986710 RepID=A0ABW2FDK7_9BACL
MGASIRPIGPPRFAVAVHILVGLARSGCNLSSTTIADQVHSHATFMRRILARLVHAGIVEAREGRDGGYRLKLPAEQITLADVFAAIRWDGAEETDGSGDDKAEPSYGEVDWNERVDLALIEIMSGMDRQMLDYLSRHTISSLV